MAKNDQNDHNSQNDKMVKIDQNVDDQNNFVTKLRKGRKKKLFLAPKFEKVDMKKFVKIQFWTKKVK